MEHYRRGASSRGDSDMQDEVIDSPPRCLVIHVEGGWEQTTQFAHLSNPTKSEPRVSVIVSLAAYNTVPKKKNAQQSENSDGEPCMAIMANPSWSREPLVARGRIGRPRGQAVGGGQSLPTPGTCRAQVS